MTRGPHTRQPERDSGAEGSRDRAGPPRACGATARGPAGEGQCGGGEPGLTIPSRLRVPPATPKPQLRGARDALTEAEGPCGPPAAAASAGCASVAPLVPAAPFRRASPPPAPAPSSSASTSGPPATQANGFRKSRPALRGQRPDRRATLSFSVGALGLARR